MPMQTPGKPSKTILDLNGHDIAAWPEGDFPITEQKIHRSILESSLWERFEGKGWVWTVTHGARCAAGAGLHVQLQLLKSASYKNLLLQSGIWETTIISRSNCRRKMWYFLVPACSSVCSSSVCNSCTCSTERKWWVLINLCSNIKSL